MGAIVAKRYEPVQLPRPVQGLEEARQGEFRDCLLGSLAEGPEESGDQSLRQVHDILTG